MTMGVLNRPKDELALHSLGVLARAHQLSAMR